MKVLPYQELLEKLHTKFMALEDAEMVAVIRAANYQHETLVKIVNSKIHAVLPSIASEAFTTVNEIAEKILLATGGLDGEKAEDSKEGSDQGDGQLCITGV